ncbi:MAG TPA: exopolysaccharide biosynthesis polyprenyl glycosylphosphotransferase [Acetobacteraceae bacterium]|nr:exopolysaccharide biosynthesis polyprenyl glycosylphosphotransferase [Acetobacteraceae bacterium]
MTIYQPFGSQFGEEMVTSADVGILRISYGQSAYWPIGGWRGAVKRVSDIVFALFVLVVFFVPMLVAALAIRLETPGPVLFRQRRIGYGNASFEMWKFRTMRLHPPEADRLTQATRHDRRVTRVGAFLRHTSLDELPQIFNILRGDMSLVGPRPHAPGTCAGGKPFEQVTPHYPARHRVKPGLTGLAQVRGWRGETETEDKLLHRVESDLEYIDNWSLWLDVVILARTVVPVFAMHNAY